jgi:signal peptidase I
MVGEAVIKKRRPWLAGLLSLPLPGLGQLYNGNVRLAWPLLAAVIVFAPAAKWLIAAVPSTAGPAVMIAILVAGLALLIFALVQSVLQARRIGAVQTAWFNRWYIYVGLYLLVGIASLALGLLPIPTSNSYNIPSSSMTPTLLPGDYLTAKANAFADHVPTRGDIVVFEMQGGAFVSRVVGLPGDRLQWRGGRLYLNGAQVDRRRVEDFVYNSNPFVQASNAIGTPVPQYEEILPEGAVYRVIERDGDLGPSDETEEFAVPEGHCFVAGDNRDGAADSRDGWGFIPLETLLDKPRFLYWSADFSRLGKVIE